MKLTEKHREFAVKCFAKFMTRTETTNAFMQEFAHDLPPPPPAPKFNRQESNQKHENEKQQYIDHFMQTYWNEYQDKYGENAEKQFQNDRQLIKRILNEEYEKAFPQDVQHERKEQLDKHQEDVEAHHKKIKKEISNQLRRLNITHKLFPEKYRELFNQERIEFFQKHQIRNLQDNNIVLTELETMYGYAKQQTFQQKDPKDVVRHLNTALNYLKVIIANFSTREQETN